MGSWRTHGRETDISVGCRQTRQSLHQGLDFWAHSQALHPFGIRYPGGNIYALEKGFTLSVIPVDLQILFSLTLFTLFCI